MYISWDIPHIPYPCPVTGRHLWFSFTLTLDSTIIRPTILFDPKNVQIPWKFHMYSICNFRYKNIWFHVRYFNFRLKTERIVYSAMLQPTAASKTTNSATLDLLHRWFTPFDLMATLFITFSPRNNPPYLHIRWRNSTTGRLNVILSSLGISRSALKNSLRYSSKTGGAAACEATPLFEG